MAYLKAGLTGRLYHDIWGEIYEVIADISPSQPTGAGAGIVEGRGPGLVVRAGAGAGTVQRAAPDPRPCSLAEGGVGLGLARLPRLGAWGWFGCSLH